MRFVFVLIAGWLAMAEPASRAAQAPAASLAPPAAAASVGSPDGAQAFLDQYCFACHNEALLKRGVVPVTFEALDAADVTTHADVWERIIRKLRARVMPPTGRPRPDHPTYDALVGWLETELDRAAVANPNPGRPAVRRLTQAEYINAIRDLLAIDIDAESLLFPADDVDQHGFETNGGVLSISPALVERYLSAANRISRLALGDPAIGPGFATASYSLPKLLYQDERMSEDLPFGTRGGMAIQHHFPLDGEYVLRIRLRRQVYDYIIGMKTKQKLDVRLNGELVKRFEVGGADSKGYPSAYTFFGMIRGDADWEEYVSVGGDAELEVRFPATAGKRTVEVAFVGTPFEPTGVLERRRPSGFVLSTMDFYHDNAAVDTVTITGPFEATGPGNTPSRQKILTCHPSAPADEESCARQILSTLARHAYRRPVTNADVESLLEFYDAGRNERGFEGGIQLALERLLVDPEFLFWRERDPENATPGMVYRLSDLELASRMSFFLWSSIPDEELLEVAAAGRLHEPTVLEQQVRRMLADARSTALVENFVSQWLQLNRVRGVNPDPDVFFDFDENLRADMERETKLFVESQLREDRGLVELLTADYTFANERLARHYGIETVYGERFRRVPFDQKHDERGGLLGHASLLTVTAYPTRTSPVLRGKWLLDNILGMPPPPPPPDVPPLEEHQVASKTLSMRERMEQHRVNPVCANCHRVMDPPGFALENYDALGRWRTTTEAGTPIDTSGVLADGTEIDGPTTLQEALLTHKEEFVSTVTEKLLMYGTGRGLEYYDQPAVREITRDAAPGNYRWSDVILGVVKSVPFSMRRAET